MNPDAQRWVELAAYDLATAEAMLTSGRYLYVTFCCQQAVEKRIKALMVDRTREFPPQTHDLTRLAHLAKLELSEDQEVFLRTLTKYYVGTRYPEEVSALAGALTRVISEQTLS